MRTPTTAPPAGWLATSAVRPGHGEHDREAKARATVAAGPRVVSAAEPLERHRKEIRWEARARVGHLDDEVVVLPSQPRRHGRTRRRVPNRVLEQVLHRATNQVRCDARLQRGVTLDA